MSSKKGSSSSSRGEGEGRRGGNPRKVRRRTEQARIKSQTKKAQKEIQSKIDRERYGAGKAYGAGKISKERIKKTEMYGGKASKMTNEYLVSIGEAKKGNPYYDHKGNITGYSYFLTSKGQEMKYGKSGSAMGSGDPTGIMTGIPISQAMHDRQKNIQAISLGALSLGAGLGGGTLMRMAAADAWKEKGQTGYQNYLNKFYGNMAGSSSYGIKSSKVSRQGTTEDFTEVSSATQVDPNKTETRTDDTRFKSKKAITKGGDETLLASRNLFGKKGKTITASMA
jgi:hypothetical protein